jgi:hypothetical protein
VEIDEPVSKLNLEARFTFYLKNPGAENEPTGSVLESLLYRLINVLSVNNPEYPNLFSHNLENHLIEVLQ